jgi:KGK domain
MNVKLRDINTTDKDRDIENVFTPLEADDAVLLFNADSFTVGRFKYLVKNQFYQRFKNGIKTGNSTILDTLKSIKIDDKACLGVEDINWRCSIDGINCKLLKVGATGWQHGKIRIKVSIKVMRVEQRNRYNVEERLEIQVYLEFCPDTNSLPQSHVNEFRNF